jgi:hypothetical protein
MHAADAGANQALPEKFDTVRTDPSAALLSANPTL